MPASSARWTIRIESSWSSLPQAPNIIAPRKSGLTCSPVRPSGRNSTRGPYARSAQVAAEEPHGVVDAERSLSARPLMRAARIHVELCRHVRAPERPVERQRLRERNRVRRAGGEEDRRRQLRGDRGGAERAGREAGEGVERAPPRPRRRRGDRDAAAERPADGADVPIAARTERRGRGARHVDPRPEVALDRTAGIAEPVCPWRRG